jgi:hypothetical protein
MPHVGTPNVDLSLDAEALGDGELQNCFDARCPPPPDHRPEIIPEPRDLLAV